MSFFLNFIFWEIGLIYIGVKLIDIKNECLCERDDISEVDVEKYY